MKLAIFGAGAVGGYVGGLLAHEGCEVTLVDMWHEHVAAIRDHGLEITGPEGSLVGRPRAVTIGEFTSTVWPEPVDIAFICVKSYDTEWIATLLKPHLAPDGFAVSLQNCLNEGTVARVLGAERTLGCVVASISVELFAPGRIRRERARRTEGHSVFRVGELDGRQSERTHLVSEMLHKVDNARVTTNLQGERWSKLANNAMNSGIAATTGLSAKQGMADAALRPVMIDLAMETVAVGTALGHALERVGKVDAALYLRAARGDGAARGEIDALLSAQGDPRPATRLSSMGQDIAKGRRTEIDFLNGYVVEMGRQAGIATPANARVVALVQEIQAGRRAPHPDNLRRLAVPG
ncbi:2-dehydropantoate 2-reductase [Ancylobacter sp. MQZ15Z-1]|uniref:2-dehydropantoate 2-reductase n=1 Tax=Ancylobacter mangrovi TaxID=2972472 RepID=A0A9X2PGX0_9HYPH|nr:2-dehydropantoate 2-reductase [Ancylobacter mangrovi]MCS0497194.1 2-dehydropantoate 2-reductase [Ancylobacter mangrovi]